MKGIIKKAGYCFLAINLFGCQTQPPKPLPVFEFNQWPETALNPASYYACGNTIFGCSPRKITIIHLEKKHEIIKKVCK